jgi:hypothetical protein
MPKKRGAYPVRSRGACPTRSRGAQPGNHNACQHNFYTSVLPPIEWDLPPVPDIKAFKSYAADTLQYEIDALRVLIRRLAALQDEPDPEMKDPDAPFKTLLSASHRLDALLRIQNTLKAHVSELEDAHYLRDIVQDWNEKSAEFSDLLTINNLEKIRLSLGGPGTITVKQSLSAEDLQKYASLFSDPPPEEDAALNS